MNSVKQPKRIGKRDRAVTIAAFKCPGCGVACEVVRTVTTGNPGILHTLPTCKFYETNEPDDILRIARERRDNLS